MKLPITNFISSRIWICCIILLAGLETSHATHIVGGEMNYRCLGNDQYEITLTVFRDCENGIPNFDNPAHIGIFDSADELVPGIGNQGLVDIDYILDDTLNPTLFDSCLVIPPEVCVDATTYIDTITLPYLSGGYNIVYQRCCRNHTILNIVGPDDTGATYSIYITEKALLECNSNAVFKQWPPTYICADIPILFDHSAIDPDGDSLVYKLCTPYHGAERTSCNPNGQSAPCFDQLQPCGPRPCPPFNPPFNNVVWMPPFDLNNVMGGVPLAIDSETGLLTGTPTIIVEDQVNQFVVGICVEEYRNGELISITKRDFQYNVGVCGEAISSFFAPAVDCDGFTVNFDNQSEDAVDFTWDFGDPTTTLDVSTATNPSYLYPDTGLYVIEMIAGPNEACADTSYSTVSVQIPSLFVDFELASLIDGCVYPAQVFFTDLSYDTISTIVAWDWQFSNGDSSNEMNPAWYVTESGIYTAILTATAANGCQVSHAASLAINVLELGLQDTASICSEDSIILNPGTDESYIYTWSPEETLSSASSPSPVATPSANTTYYVTVEDNNGCIYVDSVRVVLGGILNVQASDDETVCETSLDISATSNSAINYDWYANPELTDFIGNGQTIEVSPGTSSTYFVVATDINGCTSLDEVEVGSQTINVDVPPQVTVCENNGLTVEAINLKPDDILSYEWLPASLIVGGAGTSAPTFLLDEDGILTLVVENQYGCLDTLLVPVDVIENELNAIATAEPDSIYPGESSQLTVMTEEGDYIYQWTMGDVLDNDMIDNPIATPLVTTTFDVFVEGGFNSCKDTASVTVFLKTFFCDEPHLFVPNAFTPDNDGMNDIFYVRGLAIDEVFMAVYNRWGEKVFETNNLNTGWDGTYKGKELAPDVYGYYLRIKCLNGEEYFKKGNVTLIR